MKRGGTEKISRVRNGGWGLGTTGETQETGGVGEIGRSSGNEAENPEHLEAQREELGTVDSPG